MVLQGMSLALGSLRENLRTKWMLQRRQPWHINHCAVAQTTTNAPYVAILPSRPHSHKPPSKVKVPSKPPQNVCFNTLQREDESQVPSAKRANKAHNKAIHQAGAMKLKV
jgi:hypothetical protein